MVELRRLGTPCRSINLMASSMCWLPIARMMSARFMWLCYSPISETSACRMPLEEMRRRMGILFFFHVLR